MKYKKPILGIFLCLFLGVLPLLVSMSAGLIAEVNGCVLHEGNVNPCVILGIDLGETLYFFGFWGWFTLISLPFSMLGVIVCIIWWLIDVFKKTPEPKA